MNCYKLCMDTERKKDIIAHYYDDYGIGLNQMSIGKFYENWDNRFSFYYEKREGHVASDYLANDKGWFVVSTKLKDLLLKMNTNIQFLPVSVNEKNGEDKYDYFIANILTLVDGLCLEKSDYFESVIPKIGSIYTISKFAVYERKIEGLDVFKLVNGQEIPIFVSDAFKEAVVKNNITGIGFREIRVVSD